MQINQALFAGNGGSGYILKPNLSSLPTISKTLKIKVISAQQLPKPKDSISNSIIDPYIDVEIAGCHVDCIRYRTRSISSNGNSLCT